VTRSTCVKGPRKRKEGWKKNKKKQEPFKTNSTTGGPPGEGLNLPREGRKKGVNLKRKKEGRVPKIRERQHPKSLRGAAKEKKSTKER